MRLIHSQPAMPADQPAAGVHGHQHAVGADADEAGRLAVVAGGVHVAAPRRAPQQVPGDDEQERA